MPRNFGIVSRPSGGGYDRLTGSIAPGERNSNSFPMLNSSRASADCDAGHPQPAPEPASLFPFQLPGRRGTSVGQREGRSLSESEPAGFGSWCGLSTRPRLTSPASIQLAADPVAASRSDLMMPVSLGTRGKIDRAFQFATRSPAESLSARALLKSGKVVKSLDDVAFVFAVAVLTPVLLTAAGLLALGVVEFPLFDLFNFG